VTRLSLIASSDDYLLGEAVDDAAAAASEALGGVEPELLADDLTPEQVAVEVCSPSLFSPQRVLVVADARAWVEAPAPAGAAAVDTPEDVAPLIAALAGGLPDEVALVCGAWCGGRPKGPLVDAVAEHGEVRWIAMPPPPKPWEDVVLSAEQAGVLRQVLRRAVPELELSPAAERLLFERLGFAPRLLAAEAAKLAVAAGPGTVVDEGLVRDLCFARERSLEVVRDAVLERDPAPLVDLLAAAAAGVPITDWSGKRLDQGGLGPILLSQVSTILEQLLYLRRVLAAAGLADEVAPERTAARGWYPRVFKNELGPRILALTEDDPDSPLRRSGKKTSLWSLGHLAAAAGRYSDGDLIRALAAAGPAEAGLRGSLDLEEISLWLASLLGGAGAP
jgi:hypothetical protein